MNFKREDMKDYYLRDTHVENIFINEYMAGAPGDYVKVYLFALMYAGHDMDMDNEAIAKQLNMAIEDVLKAWSYWDSMGVVHKHLEKPSDPFHYQIEFLNLKERIYGKNLQDKKTEQKLPAEIKHFLGNDEIKSMFQEIERVSGRLLGGREPEEILTWITDYNAAPQVIVYAYTYCMKTKNHSSFKYVAAVVKKWSSQGLKTIEDVENFLQETDNRHYLYKRILKALGFMRNPTEGEKVIIDSWFDELGFNIDTVLEACKKTTGISNPNINYINTILKAWKSGSKREDRSKEGQGGSSSEKPNQISRAMKLYEEARMRHETEAEARRAEVYARIPRIIEVEEEMRASGMQISKFMLSGSGDAKNKIKTLQGQMERLNAEKAYLLTENNFNIDYMDIKYDCSACKDTGSMDSGERCSCFAQRLAQMQKMG